MTLTPRNLGGSVPPSEALPRHGGAPGAGPAREGVIATDTRGPLRAGIERIGLIAIGAVFVVFAFAVGLVVALMGLALFVAFLTFDMLWHLRFVLIGVAFAVVIAKIVGLL